MCTYDITSLEMPTQKGELEMVKLAAAILTVVLMSGCCRFFGICTSASVHTSISPGAQYGTIDNGLEAKKN
jgi:hypothetical protein